MHWKISRETNDLSEDENEFLILENKQVHTKFVHLEPVMLLG